MDFGGANKYVVVLADLSYNPPVHDFNPNHHNQQLLTQSQIQSTRATQSKRTKGRRRLGTEVKGEEEDNGEVERKLQIKRGREKWGSARCSCRKGKEKTIFLRNWKVLKTKAIAIWKLAMSPRIWKLALGKIMAEAHDRGNQAAKRQRQLLRRRSNSREESEVNTRKSQ
ncbi:hypothetical protein PIB30_068528 [Stylosanthes scabra]|uniref:Uncharacterized protein n=1 Tax=Stylosanthes scabra TaxID=79078 RepID=A0ABU6UMW2_9FABA|nr:hypothetical protein [Stylosanthes scabra]